MRAERLCRVVQRQVMPPRRYERIGWVARAKHRQNGQAKRSAGVNPVVGRHDADQHPLERIDRLGDGLTLDRAESDEHAAGSGAEPVAARQATPRAGPRRSNASCEGAVVVDPIDEHGEVQSGR